MKFLSTLVVALAAFTTLVVEAKEHAVLVAGSNGFGNYRREYPLSILQNCKVVF